MTTISAFDSRYVLLDSIGSGAMGRVYRARRSGTDQTVAIKILRDDLAREPDVEARFVRESQVLQAIAHPNVVRVHEMLTDAGRLGIVMEYVPGGSLRTHAAAIRERGFVADVVAGIADGLAAVHAAGIVHRDLKPDNILIGGDDAAPGGDGHRDTFVPKIADFGIARLVGSTNTSTNSVIGTARYMAPETAVGVPATGAADVYALGVILYELCEGHPPFEADTALALLQAHTRDPVPLPVAMAARTWTLVRAMLAKAPEDRPTAADVSAYLSGRLGMLPDPAPDPDDQAPTSVSAIPVSRPDLPRRRRAASRRRSRRGLVIGAAGVAAAVAAGVVVLVSGNDDPPASPKPPAAADAVTYVFDLASPTTGVLLQRRWTLVGAQHGTLRESLSVVNEADHVVTTEFNEAIPKELARDVAQLHFDPEPTRIVNPDPVVAYRLTLPAASTQTLSYTVQVPDDTTLTQLRSWAAAQRAAEASADKSISVLRLSGLRILGAPAHLVAGQSAPLAVTAQLGTTTAPASSLRQVAWSSSDSAILRVDQSGKVTAVSAGRATVSAQIGSARATVQVTVVPNAVAAGGSRRTGSSSGSSAAVAGEGPTSGGRSSAASRSHSTHRPGPDGGTSSGPASRPVSSASSAPASSSSSTSPPGGSSSSSSSSSSAPASVTESRTANVALGSSSTASSGGQSVTGTFGFGSVGLSAVSQVCVTVTLADDLLDPGEQMEFSVGGVDFGGEVAQAGAEDSVTHCTSGGASDQAIFDLLGQGGGAGSLAVSAQSTADAPAPSFTVTGASISVTGTWT